MDARVERTREAVMRAATDLLVEGGPTALTVDGVVARSGVAKSTVYRHWANRDELVADVFLSCMPKLRGPGPVDNFEDALTSLVRHLFEILGDGTWPRFFPSLLLLRGEQPALASIDEEMKAQQESIYREVFERGVAEGLLPQAAVDDVELTMALLIGPFFIAALVGTLPLDDELARRAVGQFLAGYAQPVESAALTP